MEVTERCETRLLYRVAPFVRGIARLGNHKLTRPRELSRSAHLRLRRHRHVDGADASGSGARRAHGGLLSPRRIRLFVRSQPCLRRLRARNGNALLLLKHRALVELFEDFVRRHDRLASLSLVERELLVVLEGAAIGPRLAWGCFDGALPPALIAYGVVSSFVE